MSVPPTLNRTDVLSRVSREVERSILRAKNGVRYVTSQANVGTTPKDVVWKRDKAELWRYRSDVPIRYDPPLVLVHSLVSRSYIFDLRPGSSTVEYLVNQGIDVFLLDFGIPDELDAENTLETYVDEYLPRAIAAVQDETGADEVTLAGYCLGGVLATLYAAGYEDPPVRNLMLLATPFDFSEMGVLVAAVREGRLDADELIDHTGNVPADALYRGFFMQAPTKQVALYATLLENLWNDEFVDGYQAMAQWSREQVPFPGAAFRQVVDDMVRRNVLMTGRMRLGGRLIDFEDAPGNVLTAFAENDKVVPLAATEPVSALVGDPNRRDELRLRGGHVTFSAGGHAFKHTLPALTKWIAAHSDALDPPKER
jgi:polyhydroxyalkanoate synthase